MTPSKSLVPTRGATDMALPARSSKIQPRHLERWAIVYVRQSTLYQVTHNTESTALQYGLPRRAEQLGWPRERILVIDDDLATSATSVEGRPGFQRLVAEVGMDHVGLILGIELSRLSRSNKDWHQLLELCALFGTLIADIDTIYDPGQFNDRLLLGLRGTMNEAELHLLKQRLHQGKLNKARRGEVIPSVPWGYLRRPDGTVSLEPDEQAQSVVRLIFQKFDEYGTINAVLRYLVTHNVQIGMRLQGGPQKGDLVWRRPRRHLIGLLLRHPMYAGTYSFGRRQVDPRCKQPGQRGTGRRVMPQDRWLVLIPDFFPRYISWEQYMSNQQRLAANQNRADQRGAIRHGPSILSGLVICGRCQQRMAVQYSGGRRFRYACLRAASDYGEPLCQSLSGKVLHQLVSHQVIEALQPAALELSLRAAEQMEQERQQRAQLFEQRLERAHYETERAARQYRLCEPENRLVARQLEREWEEKLRVEKSLQEEYDRFQQQQARGLGAKARQQIRQLASSIPALWNAPSTTAADRKAIVRQLIEKIIVEIIGDSEQVQVKIQWAGGHQTEHGMIRPVARWEQMSQFAQLQKRIQALAQRQLTSGQIAAQLNAEGWKPPKRREQFNADGVRALLLRMGLCSVHRARPYCEAKRKKNEWGLTELAKRLDMPTVTLYNWIYRGLVKARQLDGKQGRWLIWADAKEIKRLEELRQQPLGHWNRKHWLRGKEKN